MITIFTIPRAFEGEFVHIQLNALRSWLLLEPQPQVLLFGLEEGAEVAQDMSLPISPIARNEHGTPLVSDALNQARAKAACDILVMANADNIYLSDFLPAVQACARAFPRFLMIGQRWDAQWIDGLVDFSQGWEERLREDMRQKGCLHPKGAVDYLAFRDGAWLADLPPFAVGRTGYDGDIVARTLRAGIPVVDATRAVMVVHQDHAVPLLRVDEKQKNEQMRIGRGGVGYANWKLVGGGAMEPCGAADANGKLVGSGVGDLPMVTSDFRSCKGQVVPSEERSVK